MCLEYVIMAKRAREKSQGATETREKRSERQKKGNTDEGSLPTIMTDKNVAWEQKKQAPIRWRMIEKAVLSYLLDRVKIYLTLSEDKREILEWMTARYLLLPESGLRLGRHRKRESLEKRSHNHKCF
jgi:hypothetical protein